MGALPKHAGGSLLVPVRSTVAFKKGPRFRLETRLPVRPAVALCVLLMLLTLWYSWPVVACCITVRHIG
jgi:hypothetical protein